MADMKMVRVDMTPVDEIFAMIGKLNRHQRAWLEFRIVDRPGVLRTHMGAWALLRRKELQKELPEELRKHVDRFWRAVDAVCRRDDRRPQSLPRCCRLADKR